MKMLHDCVLRSRLWSERYANGMTQQQLADRVGVSRQTIVRLERGKSEPSVLLAICIAEALGRTVHDIFQAERQLHKRSRRSQMEGVLPKRHPKPLARYRQTRGSMSDTLEF